MTEGETGVGRTLRVGVVGIGVMGSNHARVLAELPGVKLAGVADPDAKQADFVGNALGCPTVTEVSELLDLGVDAVSIAAPTHLHRDIALACISRGVHVLVESRSPRRSRKAAISLPPPAAPALR